MSARLAPLALAAMLAACQHAPAPPPAPVPAPPPSPQLLPPAASGPAGPPCLAPIRPGMADPDVRDLQYRVFERDGGTVVSMLACVVSDRFPAVESLRIVATVIEAGWANGGTQLRIVGDEILRLNPVTPRRPGQPRLIAMLGREINQLPAGTTIAPGALLRLRIQPCVGADAGQCGATQTQEIALPPRAVVIRGP